jgi:hypothetical protein
MNGKPGHAPATYCKLMLKHAFTDVLKGSYYANPLIDVPTVSAQDAKLYPEYYGKNICEYTVIQMEDLTQDLPRAKTR